MFSLALHRGFQQPHHAGRQRALRHQVVRHQLVGAEAADREHGPSTASGGMIALTREPSLSRASTIGLDSSTRRPTWETILSMMRSRCPFVVEAHVGQLQKSLALHVDLLVAVHQDVGDGAVLEQRLERSQPEDLVQHLGGDPLLLGGGQQVRLFVHHGQHRLPHFGADAVVVDARQRLQIDALQQLAVQREFQLLVLGVDLAVAHFFTSFADQKMVRARAAAAPPHWPAPQSPASRLPPTLFWSYSANGYGTARPVPEYRKSRHTLQCLGDSLVEQTRDGETLALASSMSVSTLRVERAGMLNPETVTPLAGSMVETSGLTCS